MLTDFMSDFARSHPFFDRGLNIGQHEKFAASVRPATRFQD
jgi:hypothetical protein